MYLIAQHIRFSVIVHISEGSVGQIEGFVCVEEMFVWHQKKKNPSVYDLHDQTWKPLKKHI